MEQPERVPDRGIARIASCGLSQARLRLLELTPTQRSQAALLGAVGALGGDGARVVIHRERSVVAVCQLAGVPELEPWLGAAGRQQLCQPFGLFSRARQVTHTPLHAHEQPARCNVVGLTCEVVFEQRCRFALLPAVDEQQSALRGGGRQRTGEGCQPSGDRDSRCAYPAPQRHRDTAAAGTPHRPDPWLIDPRATPAAPNEISGPVEQAASRAEDPRLRSRTPCSAPRSAHPSVRGSICWQRRRVFTKQQIIVLGALAAPRARRLAFLCAGSLALLTACDLFERDRRPYTPFPVATGRPLEEPPPLASAEPPPVAAPRLRSVLQAPSRATRWRIGERELEAPPGLVFRLALAGTLASGDPNDVVAWLVGQPGGPIGELWFFPATGAPRRLATPPSFIPTGPTCQHSFDLEASGKNSVTFDVSATCTTPLLPRAPTRSVSVLAPLREQPLILSLQLAPAALGERLDVDVVSDDRDGDELDDVELIVTLEAPSGPAANARFVWLDRPPGPSQDASEPAKSFADLGSAAVTRAKAGGTFAEVQAQVDNARRLYGAVCAEGGVPRVFDSNGAPIPCGGLSTAFDAFTEAVITAALAERDVPAAFGALERHTWYPTAGADPKAVLERWVRALKREAVVRRVIQVVPLKARPKARANTPRFSPLTFHPDGSLLMLTDDGVVRAAPDARYEYDASDEIDPWPTLVVSPWGDRLLGIEFPCDRNEVSFVTSSIEGAPRPPLTTSIVAPRPGRCGRTQGFDLPELSPRGWTQNGLGAWIGAIPVGPRHVLPIPSGSATSHNGQHSVVATRWGLLVSGESKSALWVFDDAALPAQLSDCVVSGNAQAAACILGSRAFVVLPDPKSG